MTDREQNILDMFVSTVAFDAENFNDYKTLPDAVANFLIVKFGVPSALHVLFQVRIPDNLVVPDEFIGVHASARATAAEGVVA